MGCVQDCMGYNQIFKENIRIEIQILSLHWMIKHISFLMSPRTPILKA